jgi:hypothetical protein
MEDQVACVVLLVERGADKEAKNNVRCAAPSPAAAACQIDAVKSALRAQRAPANSDRCSSSSSSVI